MCAMNSEHLLPGVADEDKPLVDNVINVMKKTQIMSSWQVIASAKRYEVLGWINLSNTEEVVLNWDTINLIKQINYLRVEMPRVKIKKNGTSACISVIVIPHKEPAMLEEQILEITVKKRRLWPF